MNFIKIIFIFVISFIFVLPLMAQKEMTEEEFQKQIDSLTLRKINLIEQVIYLEKIKDSIKTDSKKLDSILGEKKAEMYKILGVNNDEVAKYRENFWNLYDQIKNKKMDYGLLAEKFEEFSKINIRLLYEFRKPYEEMEKNLENYNK